MKKSKMFWDVRFTSDVINAAVELYKEILGEQAEDWEVSTSLSLRGADWQFDNLEEFLAEFRDKKATGHVRINPKRSYDNSLGITYYDTRNIHKQRIRGTTIEVTAPNRATIERVFSFFERGVDAHRLPEEPVAPPVIFIGHGRSLQWRDLKDHLHEKHGHAIEAYEIGARAGHTIRDILEEMLKKSSFAVLVMTAEDEMASGEYRARENVVHEVGLFQGRLGFGRAIVLIEEGVEPFSNLQGVHQLRYPAGAIAVTYGDVLATIRREFG
jgi:Predicted nucleotide-binding protein containing TIR-like domain